MHTRVSSSYVIEHEVADTLSGKFETFWLCCGAPARASLLLFILAERTRLKLIFFDLASCFLCKNFVDAIKFVKIATFF